MVEWDDFQAIEIKVGTICEAEEFPEARNPSYKVKVDLGPLGIRQSSAQITVSYSPEELIGKQVICVTNFPPKQIAHYRSEVLITGFVVDGNDVVLAVPDRAVPNGTRLA